MKSLATKAKSSTSGAKKTGKQRTSSVHPINAAARTQVRDTLRPNGMQHKLAINRRGDRYEQEADAVANKVVAGQPVPEISALASGNLQTQPIEEEEELLQPNLQRQLLEEEEEEMQMKSLQRQAEEEEEEEEELQASGKSSGRPAITQAVNRAIQKKDSGSPLNPSTRQALEQSIGTDFGHVRVHNDTSSRRAADDINAQAFTHQNDIWLGKGASQNDLHLMAHEATHVVQQGAGGDAIQRDEPPAQTENSEEQALTETVDPSTLPTEVGRKVGDVITFDEIQVPSFKLADHRGQLYGGRRLRRQKNYQRTTSEGSNPAQRNLWKEQVGQNSSTIVEKLTRKVRTARGGAEVNPEESLVLQGVTQHGAARYFIGTMATIARELTLPTWMRGGEGKSYDVDHIVELQLANWNSDSWGNTLTNMELLDSSANRSSGATIKSNIERKVSGFITATGGQFGNSPAQVMHDNHLEFESASPGGGRAVSADDFWTKEQIRQGDHLNPVEVRDQSVLGGEGNVLLFPNITGGQPKGFAWPGENITPSEKNWLKPYEIKSKNFNAEPGAENSEEIGSLSFNIPEDHNEWQPFAEGDRTIAIGRIPGARYAGYINKSSLRSSLSRLRQKRFSPIEITSFDILPDEGLSITGQILPDTPIIQGTGIDFEVTGNNITLSKSFTIGDFHIPAPFTVRDSNLIIALSTESGLTVDGRVDFGINRVGEGFLAAGMGTAGGFNLLGGFSFDTELFDPAEIEIRYENDVFSATGRLGIPQGKVRGVRSANITASYSEGRLQADGTAQLDVPGVEQGDLSVRYSEEEGFALGGSFQLNGDIPGIHSGLLEAEVVRRPEGQGYEINARGTAQPDIPGIDTSLTVAYENGAITIEGRAAYERGMLSGSILVGATNRPVDTEGNPDPAGEPTRQMQAYGGGEVGLRLAPWLQATIGVRLLANGEIEVSGSVGLPDALELFPEKSLEKNIFSINLDIPIIGMAVAGQRIGIFATIGGGLDVSAGIGPGELRELGITVTYNPDHEDQTHVTGSAQLVIPAHAGLRLFVRGSLGAGIPLVSASAGLEVGGSLGLEGAVEAGVEVDWTPDRGLVLDARGEIYVEPKFRFDITGFVLVELDLFLTTIELYSQRWELASFEYGSGLRFGILFPIHYEEGQPFDISLNDVDFQVPDIDTEELLSGLIERIT